jgi:phage-related minor tail protein
VALNIGELVAYLKSDDSQLRQGLNQAQERVRGFGESAKQGLAVAGAAAGAMIGVGIAQNLDIGAGRAKLAAQLNLSKDDSARIGAVAGQVYADNWGGSLDEINASIKAIGNNIGDVSKMSSADLKSMSESALALADTFDLDVNDSTRAAGQLMKTGLAANATEAFDIITTGMQTGVDKSGDFLDTLNEYSPQFAKLGITGTQALGILQDGLKAGARDTDAIADAFKEFSIRAIDGSTTTSDGFKAIGLNAKTASAAIAKGGDGAATMTQTVLQSLLKMKDPIKQNAAGTALFGTQWEDTVRKTLPALAQMSDAADTVAGSTQHMADVAGTSGKAKIETMKRSVEQWIQAQTNSSSALGTTTAAIAAFAGPGFAMAGTAGQIAAGLGAMNIGAMASATWTAIAATGTKIWAGTQWLLNAAMSANPIGLIVIAIIALVAGIIYAWRNSETFRKIVIAAWNGIKAAGSAVFGWLGTYVPMVFEKVKAVAMVVWGFISGYIRMQINIVLGIVRGVIAVYTFFRDAFNRANSAVVGAVSSLIGYVRGVPGRILGALGNVGGLLYNAGRQVIQGIINGIRSMLGALGNIMSEAMSKVAGFLPGSPVKTGPLRVLNDGYAGRQIGHMIVGGIDDVAPRLQAAVSGALSGIPAPRVGGVGVPAAPRQQAQAQVTFRGDRRVLDFIRSLVQDYGGGDPVVAFSS